jgi:hypothetical protein
MTFLQKIGFKSLKPLEHLTTWGINMHVITTFNNETSKKDDLKKISPLEHP